MTSLQQALIKVGIADTKSNKQYQKLDKQARLLRTLIKETGGKVPSNILKKIVSNLDLSKFWDVEIVETVQQFEECACNGKQGLYHSWAGCYYTNFGIEVLYGDCEPGTNFDIGYSYNGDMGTPDREYVPPTFSTDKLQVVSITTRDYNSYNNNSTTDEYEYKLVFFLPNTPYEIDEELIEILKLLK